jgi:hypothetical protein
LGVFVIGLFVNLWEVEMHLTKSEIILYSTQFGLTDVQRQNAEKHLLLCEACSASQRQFADKIQRMVAENELECQAFENDMADFLLGELSLARNQAIQKHLEDCPRCRFVFHFVKKFLPADAADPAVGGVSMIKKISRYLAELKSTLGTIVNLSIIPLSEAPAFLGKHTPSGLTRISHTGGDICLNIPKPFKNISLLTPDFLELKTLKTDEFGIVVFKDYLPGEYQIGVEGFEVSDVKYLQLADKDIQKN